MSRVRSRLSPRQSAVFLALAISASHVARAQVEPWVEFGPYPWGLHYYAGTVQIQGQDVLHLLQVWYPAEYEGLDAPAASDGAPFPVIFFQHAGGSSYAWYDYQFSRLATHGIIVVSMAHDHFSCPGNYWECHGQLYTETIDLLFDVWNENPDHLLFQRFDSGRIGLAGHSHGSAFVAMREYRPMNPGAVYEIACVSLIAPCPDYWDSLDYFATVYAGMPPLQVIYGSKDTDSCCAHGQSTAMFEVGDRPKHFTYVIGADHYSFCEGGPGGTATIPKEQAYRASAASMVAFHAWILNGDETALPYLRGDLPLLVDAPEVRYQFLDPVHRVVDDFEDEVPGEPRYVAAIAGVPGQTFINGFLSDTFVDFEAGVALIREEIQRLLPPDPPEPYSVLFYEDDALGPDVYGEALAREVAAGLIYPPATASSQDRFATLIDLADWHLIVAANQNGSSSAVHPFDDPLTTYVCDGGKAIISDFRVSSPTADDALLCAQTDFDDSTNWSSMYSTSDLFAGTLALRNPGWGIWTYGLATDAEVYAAFDEVSGGVHDPLRNSLGMPVVPTGMETFDEQFMLQEGRTLYHPTWGLEFAWTAPGASFREELADQGSGPFDASRWRVLSFRILQLHGDPLNPYDSAQDLRVRLIDWDGDVADLSLSEAVQGPLRYPASPAPGIGWKSILETYRFPLAEFVYANPSLNTTRLRSIEFVCDLTPTGRLFIDDIEFSAIAADIDGDGDVDLGDLSALLAAYDRCVGDLHYNPAADFDYSGCVDLSDLATLLANYGISPQSRTRR